MPWPLDLHAELKQQGGRRCTRRHRGHQPGEVVDSHRAEVHPFVFFTEFALCVRCERAVCRIKRYGPGATTETDWTTAP